MQSDGGIRPPLLPLLRLEAGLGATVEGGRPGERGLTLIADSDGELPVPGPVMIQSPTVPSKLLVVTTVTLRLSCTRIGSHGP